MQREDESESGVGGGEERGERERARRERDPGAHVFNRVLGWSALGFLD